jgi:RNA polymerase sigma factor (TIGR02999 family)
MDQKVTALFARMRQGDKDALKGIIDALYSELHGIAVRQMRRESPRHTLQATALVNEAYLRLLDGPDQVNDRHHFLALAATTMRRALVDYARQKRANKRGGHMARVTLDGLPGADDRVVDVLAMDEALTALAAVNERASRVVELRFFGGHTDQEVATILGFSLPTVRRDWDFARKWLKTRLRAAHD